MRNGLLKRAAGFVLATTAMAPSAWASDANFKFFPTVEYSVSISLDSEPRCTLPAQTTPPDGTSCTVTFDGSTSHTFYFSVANGYSETFTYNPGMPVHETCILIPINHAHADLNGGKMVDCGDADADDSDFQF